MTFSDELFCNSNFYQDYCNYCRKFDELAENLFNGEQLDRLSADFLEKYESYLETKFVFKSLRKIRSNTSELMNEDMKIITKDDCYEDLEFLKPQQYEQITPSQIEIKDPQKSLQPFSLADLYRRACQACYLRITFNKSRKKQEDNRLEAVQLGRQALRFNSNSFPVAYWYLISLGWYLDPIKNPHDRTLVAQLFKEAAIRCCKLNPQDALAHHLLGRYYYNVARLSWLELTLARGLLNAKFEGTFEDSEREFKRAHELASDWLPTGLWMARVLLAQHRPIQEVSQWIEFGLGCDCTEPSTELERAELLELRSKLKIKTNDM